MEPVIAIWLFILFDCPFINYFFCDSSEDVIFISNCGYFILMLQDFNWRNPNGSRKFLPNFLHPLRASPRSTEGADGQAAATWTVCKALAVFLQTLEVFFHFCFAFFWIPAASCLIPRVLLHYCCMPSLAKHVCKKNTLAKEIFIE